MAELKPVLKGIAAFTLAGVACGVVANLPPQPTAEGTATRTPEITPTPDYDQAYSGTVIHAVDPEVQKALAEGTGYPESAIGGFTIQVDRGAGLSKLEVKFGIAPEEAIQADGSTVAFYREYMYLDGADEPIPLYKYVVEKDGKEYVQLKLSTSSGPVIGEERVVLEYPADTMDRFANNLSTSISFYPPDELRDDLLLANGLPIEVSFAPDGKQVDPLIPVPFSDVEIAYKPKAGQGGNQTGNSAGGGETTTNTEQVVVPKYEASLDPRFAELGIPVYQIPSGDHFNGKLQSFWEANAKPFDPTKIVSVSPTVYFNQQGEVESTIYNQSDYTLWEDSEAKPFRKSETIGYTKAGNYEYLVLPVEFVFADNTTAWVDTVFMIKGDGDVKFELTSDEISEALSDWFSDPGLSLNFKPIVLTDEALITYSRDQFPQEKLNEVAKRFGDVVEDNNVVSQGDPQIIKELGKSGIILPAAIVK